jgi:hypothetical protein
MVAPSQSTSGSTIPAWVSAARCRAQRSGSETGTDAAGLGSHPRLDDAGRRVQRQDAPGVAVQWDAAADHVDHDTDEIDDHVDVADVVVDGERSVGGDGHDGEVRARLTGREVEVGRDRERLPGRMGGEERVRRRHGAGEVHDGRGDG